jgi:hypothetical protein
VSRPTEAIRRDKERSWCSPRRSAIARKQAKEDAPLPYGEASQLEAHVAGASRTTANSTRCVLIFHVATAGSEDHLGKEALIREMIANDVTILLGETGSGKTTRNKHRSYLPIGRLSHFAPM